MNIVFWILQILVGVMFAFHGYMLAFQHHQAKTQPGMSYIGELPDGLRNFIAACEVLGGIGLILPTATGILVWLTPVAGALLALVMLLAVGFHLLRQEYRNIILNVILGVLAAAVAYGRFVVVPLS